MKSKVGVYICSCGTNISDNLDFDELVSFSPGLEDVAYAKVHSLFCSEDGKNFLADDIINESPDRVVIAACSPKEHEKTFRDVLQKAGVNPYLFQMVNIREQVAWVTADKAAATEKAKAYIRAAVRRVSLNEPLEKQEIACNTDAVVIGAGPQGWSPPSCSDKRQAERFILSPAGSSPVPGTRPARSRARIGRSGYARRETGRCDR